MTATVLSLAKARKARAKADKQAEAQANRAKFGRTKAERAVEQAEAERVRKALDAVCLERTTDGD